MKKSCLKLDTAIILAGGMSKRMGYSKETMEFNGRPLMDQLIEKLSISFDEIIVVSKNQKLYKDKDNVIMTFDEFEGRGPLAGLHAGLAICKSEFAFLIACDMPYLNNDYIDFMKGKLDKSMDALVYRSGDFIEPFNGFYNVNLFDNIDNYLKQDLRSMNKFIRDLDLVSYIEEEEAKPFSPDLRMFSNMNTQEDVAKLETINEDDSAQVSYVKINRIKNSSKHEMMDQVINECPLTLYVNNVEVYTFLASPKSIEYLLVGYLYLNGFIKNYAEIKRIEIDKNNGVCHVDIASEVIKKPDKGRAFDEIGKPIRPEYKKSDAELKAIDNNNLQIDGQIISELSVKFEKMSKLFEDTGAAHSCALIEKDSFIEFEEDVARNNCIDKMVGRVMMNDIDISNMVLMTSCRVSVEIILKAIKLGIKAIVSVAAVTSLSVEFAQKYNVTLIGFARGNRFNVYTNNELII